MRVFITGATGFIGSAVTRELVARGHQVTGLTRSRDGVRALASLGAVAVQGDLAEPGAWSRALSDSEAAIHLGTGFGPDMAEVDRIALGALIAAAGGGTRLIYTGGAWVFGPDSGRPIGSDSPFDPMPEFSWMVAGLQRLQDAQVPHAVIHPAIVHDGEGGAFARFADTLKAGQMPEIWGSEAVRWPLVHRDDLARAYRMVLEAPMASGSYTVAAEKGVSVGTIIARLAARMGRPADFRVVARGEALQRYGTMAAGPMRDQQMGAGRIMADLGWTPLFPSVAAE